MFKCTGYGDCTMAFTRSEHLARHVRKHTGERPFKCHCGRTFSRLDNVRQHAGTVHAESPAKNAATMAALVALHNSLSASSAKAQVERGMVVKDPAAAAAKKARRAKNSEQAQDGGFNAAAAAGRMPASLLPPHLQQQQQPHPLSQPGYGSPYSQHAVSSYPPSRPGSPFIHSMVAVGLGGRDPDSLNEQEHSIVQSYLRRSYPAPPPQHYQQQFYQQQQPPGHYQSPAPLYSDAPSAHSYYQSQYGHPQPSPPSPPPSNQGRRRSRPSPLQPASYPYYPASYGSNEPVSPPTPPSASRVTLPPISQLLPTPFAQRQSQQQQQQQPEAEPVYYASTRGYDGGRPPASVPNANLAGQYVPQVQQHQQHYPHQSSSGPSPTTSYYSSYSQAAYAPRPTSVEPSPSLSNSSSFTTAETDHYGYNAAYVKPAFPLPPSTYIGGGSVDFAYDTSREGSERNLPNPWPVTMDPLHHSDDLKQRAIVDDYSSLSSSQKRSRGPEEDDARGDWKRVSTRA